MFKFSALTMDATELQRRAEQIRRDSETPVQNAEPDFKHCLKSATQRRLAGAHQPSRIEANVSASNESFADKIKRSIAARQPRAQTQKEHAKQVQKEDARYTYKRRQRSKSD